MIRLIDGPAAGSYAVKRAPLYLRAVKSLSGARKDVLDQIDDAPELNELVYVYERQGDAGTVHLNFGGGKSRARTGFYATGEYLYLSEVEGNSVREPVAWRRWVEARTGQQIDPLSGRPAVDRQ